MKLLDEIEIGWHLGQFAWGRGFATEAAKAVMDYGLNVLKLDVINAVVYPENEKSIRVMERLEMTPLGITDQYFGLSLLKYQKTA